MASLWESYKTIDYAAPTPVLTKIASATLVSDEDRKALIQGLLTDIQSFRFQPNDKSTALLAIKSLARIPAGSETLIEPSNLKILLNLSSSGSQDAITSEALRCVANALLLVERGRSLWLEIGGGQVTLDLLQNPKTNPEFCFLAGRLLFLTTLTQNDFMKRICEDQKLIETIAARYDFLLAAVLSDQKLAKEALTDLLKFTFNLLLQYPRMVDAEVKHKASQSPKGKGKEDPPPKVMGEQWDERFEPLHLPLIRTFLGLPNHTTPPLTAPLTHVIHALLNVPVPLYTSIWFSPPPPGSPSFQPTRSNGEHRTSFSESFSRALAKLRSNGSSSRSSVSVASSSGSGSGSKTPRKSTSPPPIPQPTYDIVKHATALVDRSLAHYFPGAIEVDDIANRNRARNEGVNIDELMAPLLLLLTRFAEDPGARKVLKDWLLPEDLDREAPLETRPDTLGRVIRLMSCVYFPRLKDAVGELMYTICDSDGGVLSTEIGYGNAAGYLFNKGMMAPPTTSSTSSSNGTSAGGKDNINPITGSTNKPDPNPADEMSDEEKEREAEKLFVLFDRLEKTGMGVQNPIRKAIQEGKLSMGPFGP